MSFGAPFPAGRREVLRTHLGHAENGSGASSYSFSGLNFGTASVDRYIVVGVVWFGVVALTAVTIGGVAATSLVSDTSTGRNTAILIAKVPTGTSGTVALTFSGSASSASVDLYSVIGIPSAAAASTATSIANNPTASLNVARNGVVIAVATAGAGSPPSATWTGLTEDTDDSYGTGNQCRSSASAQFSTAQTGLTVTCTFTATNFSSGCFAVFEPA